ncbi:hypothetical protein [Cryobacterium lyxosi]|uniref:DUF2384 domain-containing protein n=1 Tax=Cryobacterium lyxosi TaxID=1259228 RepID=A0A4R8ZKN5_9MICO|nr:hypothetical protein [Cryobacterium lyxosi]TFD28653.1 hypothetical protein E3T27_01815 [Cryobacterium lyxosi]
MNLNKPGADILGLPATSILHVLNGPTAELSRDQVAGAVQPTKQHTETAIRHLILIGLIATKTRGNAAVYRLNREHVLWSAINDILNAPARVQARIVGIVNAFSATDVTVAMTINASDGEQLSLDEWLGLMIVFADGVRADPRKAFLTAIRQNLQVFTGNEVRIFETTRTGLKDLIQHDYAAVQSITEKTMAAAGPDITTLLAYAASSGPKPTDSSEMDPGSTWETSGEADVWDVLVRQDLSLDEDVESGAISPVLEAVSTELTDELIAFIAGVSDARIAFRWRQGTLVPSASAQGKLRCARKVVTLFEEFDALDAVESWLEDLNPEVGGLSPARLIREHESPEVEGLVLAAARKSLEDFLRP